ncbi:MAG: hypothetical protein D6796_15500, partial [Caldilineae bacterium]
QPALDPSVAQVFLPVDLSEQAAVRQAAQETGRALDVETVQLLYEAGIVGAASVRYVDRKRKVDEQTEKVLLAPPPEGRRGTDWESAQELPLKPNDLASGPERVGAEQGPFFAPVPEAANSARELKSIGKDLSDWLYYNSRLPLTVQPELGIAQMPGETLRAFKIRLQHAARERRDEEVDKLERKYEKQIDRLRDKLRRQERELAADEAEYEARKREEMLGIGESVVGFFLGRRSTRAISRAATKRRMTTKAKMDIEETKEEIEDLKAEIAELETELKEATEEITNRWVEALENLTTEEIAPRRTDVNVHLVALAWLPSWYITTTDGRTYTVPAWPQPEEEEA